MRCQLQDYERKPEFEKGLQGNQAGECVVITLLRGSEKMCNQQDRQRTRCDGPGSSKDGEADRTIDTEDVLQPPNGSSQNGYQRFCLDEKLFNVLECMLSSGNIPHSL